MTMGKIKPLRSRPAPRPSPSRARPSRVAQGQRASVGGRTRVLLCWAGLRHWKMTMNTLPSCAESFTCPSFTCRPRVARGAVCACWAWVTPLEDEDEQVKHLHTSKLIWAGNTRKPSGRYSGHTQRERMTSSVGCSKRPPFVRAYAPTRSSKSHPWAPPPDPPLKPGPVFVASGGVTTSQWAAA